jgi:uncharacterized cupin superfamily protein
VPAENGTWPYHLHHANEELLLVLEGAPTLRTPAGERELASGDAEIFTRGPSDAHAVVNRSGRPARLLVVSTIIEPEISEYPDSEKLGLFAGLAPGGPAGGTTIERFVRAEDVGYYDGEPGPI